VISAWCTAVTRQSPTLQKKRGSSPIALAVRIGTVDQSIAVVVGTITALFTTFLRAAGTGVTAIATIPTAAGRAGRVTPVLDPE
jgi:hypothetical protein